MRALIVCHFFPPQNSIGARRPFSWFRHWSESGHEVTVLTTRKTEIDAPFEPFAPDDLWRARVEEVGYEGFMAKALAPLMAPKRGAARDGARDARVTAAKPSAAKRALRKVRSSLLANYGEPRMAWTRRAIARGARIVRDRSIDVVVSSSPPYMCHTVAAELKASFPHLFWVADFRDLWSGSHIHRGARVVEAIERKHERRTLAAADLIFTVSEPLAAHLRQMHKAPVRVVFNGIESEALAHISSQRALASGKRRLVYTGTTYPGQDFDALFGGLERLAREDADAAQKLEVVFYGDSGIVAERLERFAAAKPMVRLMGPVPRDEALAAQRGADGLLFLGWADNRNSATRGVLSGKIFEYIGSGNEIFAVGGPRDADVNALVERFDAGRGYGADAGEVCAGLRRLAQQGGKRTTRTGDFLREFDRGALAARAASFIEEGLATRAGATP